MSRRLFNHKGRRNVCVCSPFFDGVWFRPKPLNREEHVGGARKKQTKQNKRDKWQQKKTKKNRQNRQDRHVDKCVGSVHIGYTTRWSFFRCTGGGEGISTDRKSRKNQTAETITDRQINEKTNRPNDRRNRRPPMDKDREERKGERGKKKRREWKTDKTELGETDSQTAPHWQCARAISKCAVAFEKHQHQLCTSPSLEPSCSIGFH